MTARGPVLEENRLPFGIRLPAVWIRAQPRLASGQVEKRFHAFALRDALDALRVFLDVPAAEIHAERGGPQLRIAVQNFCGRRALYRVEKFHRLLLSPGGLLPDLQQVQPFAVHRPFDFYAARVRGFQPDDVVDQLVQ